MVELVDMGYLIYALGGTKKVAAFFGVSEAVVGRWRVAGRLPVGRAKVLADRLGIDRDLLANPWRDDETRLSVFETYERLYRDATAEQEQAMYDYQMREARNWRIADATVIPMRRRAARGVAEDIPDAPGDDEFLGVDTPE